MDIVPLFAGIDLGTSGVRAIIIDDEDNVRVTAKCDLSNFGSNQRDRAIWWSACFKALKSAIEQVSASNIKAISVGVTSGTVLSVNAKGEPTADGLMYNDPCPDPDIVNAVAQHSPADSPTRSCAGGLSCMLSFRTTQTDKFIGDSPAHDVVGGRNAGLQTTLVRTGLHAELSDESVLELCRHQNAIPDYVIPAFTLSEQGI